VSAPGSDPHSAQGVRSASGGRELRIPVAGGELAALEFGPSTAPAVVAVHGITANAAAWGAVAAELGEHARLIAVDLRGRGGSSALPGPYGLAAHVSDLVGVLEHLDLEPAVLVGHSLGAYVISRLAVEHRERVARLVLVDGGLTLPEAQRVTDPQAFADAFLGPALARLRMSFESVDEGVRWWGEHPAFRGADVDREILRAYVARDLRLGKPGALRSCAREEAVRADAGELHQLGSWAPRLTVPALLLCAPAGLLGEPAPMQPPELARGWAAAAAERRAEQLPCTNHYTIQLGARGARRVAEGIRETLTAARGT
jgi:pimeloyl-ACP methyl ester carboxylesterase